MQVWLPNQKSVTGEFEEKVVAVAGTRMLCESAALQAPEVRLLLPHDHSPPPAAWALCRKPQHLPSCSLNSFWVHDRHSFCLMCGKRLVVQPSGEGLTLPNESTCRHHLLTP